MGVEQGSNDGAGGQPTEVPTPSLDSLAASVESEASPSPEAETPSPQPVEAAPPPYEPKFTYRVKDTEKTFPEWMRPVVKDAETEKQLREILQKADGIDFVKEERKLLMTKAEQAEKAISERYEPLNQHVAKLSGFVQKKDYDSFFAAAQIDKKDVLNWALQYAQMSPEARSAHDRAVGLGLQTSQLQDQQVSQQDHYARQMADYRTRELDFYAQRPEVSRVEQAFDARMGPGSFRTEVIRRGQFYAHQGQDITVEQAVTEVVKLVGFMADSQMPGANVQPPHVGVTPQMPVAQSPGLATPASVRAQAAKPVIPNMQGSGTSPAKRVPKSFDDLERRRQELEGA